MKIAINGQQLASTLALPALLDLIESVDVNAIELWPANLPGHGATPEEDQTFQGRDLAGTAALLKSRGIEVACLTLDGGAIPLSFARGGAAATAGVLQGAVDAAVILGAKLVNCYNSGVPLALFREAVTPAAAYAAAKGVVITLENEAHDDSAIPESIAALVAAVGSPGFATQYDPCNYYHAGLEPYPASYEVVRPHIRYVHLKGGCHYHAGRPGVHQGSTMRGSNRDFIGYVPMPEAAFPLEAIVRRLKRDGYTGWVTLEPHVPAEHMEAFYQIEVPFLKNLLTPA